MNKYTNKNFFFSKPLYLLIFLFNLSIKSPLRYFFTLVNFYLTNIFVCCAYNKQPRGATFFSFAQKSRPTPRGFRAAFSAVLFFCAFVSRYNRPTNPSLFVSFRCRAFPLRPHSSSKPLCRRDKAKGYQFREGNSRSGKRPFSMLARGS